MTSGNVQKVVSSVMVDIDYYYKGALTVSPQGSFELKSTKSRVWNGGDRPKVDYSLLPKGDKRVYTIPVTVTTRKGKSKTILVKRAFRDWRPSNKDATALADIPHSYSCQFQETHDALTRWHYPNALSNCIWGDMTVTRVSGWPNWGSGENTLPTLDANDQISLVGKLKSAIHGSDFNLAVTAAEGQEVMHMIGSTAVRLAKAFRLTRKGDFGEAARVLTSHKDPKGRGFKATNDKVLLNSKAGSSSWLELQYGWLPLLGDVKAGAERLANAMTTPKTTSYRVRTRRVIKYKAPVYGWNWSAARYTLSREIIAYLTYAPSVLDNTGITDPELVAWELLPFSFVADWVIPIGDYLEARSLSSSLTGTFVTTDFSEAYCRGISSQRRDPSEPAGHTVSGNSAYQRLVSVDRTVSSTLSVPLPTVKSVKEIASWQHMANGLALMVSTFKDPDRQGLDRKISRHQAKSNTYWNEVVNKSKGSF